jgi:hypothetical protein
MQIKNPLIKFVLVEDSAVMPMETVMTAVSPIVLIRHPIFEPHLGYFENVIIAYREDGTSIDDDLTVKNIKQLFQRGRFNFIDGMNAELITKAEFTRPLVSLVINHPSINEMAKSLELYLNLAKFMFEAGVNKFPEYDFAIINALEVKEVSENFQLEQFRADQKFFLAILQNKDVGFLYEGPIIKEGKIKKGEEIKSADVIENFIQEFRDNKLPVYLKTETIDATPVIREGILRVYGSNFISLVKDRKYAQSGTMKGLILMFTK